MMIILLLLVKLMLFKVKYLVGGIIYTCAMEYVYYDKSLFKTYVEVGDG